MHFSTIFLHLAAIVQVKAAAVGQASYFVSKINLSIIGANSQNATVQKKTELSVEFTGTAPDHPYGPSCGLYTTFPVPPDEWSFCPGGEFYIRARGLTNSAKIEFDLDFARMQSKGFVEYGDPPDAQSMVTAERGTTRIIGNSTGDPKNSLVCKSENQDIKCSFEQPITGISMTSTQSTYDFDKLRVENAITCGSLISQHSTFDFELDIVNPMNTFVLPDSVSEAAEQGRYISPPEFSCKGSRKRGGLSSEDINGWNFLIETKCTNGLSYIEAIYERPFVGAPNLKLLLASLHHIGVGGMDIRWNVNMKIGKGEEIEGGECEGEVCRREDFEAEIQRIAFGNFVNATCTERCGI